MKLLFVWLIVIFQITGYVMFIFNWKIALGLLITSFILLIIVIISLVVERIKERGENKNDYRDY